MLKAKGEQVFFSHPICSFLDDKAKVKVGKTRDGKEN